MAAHPEVRFVFKDWPILDRGDDVTSQYAARAALAAHQQGKYLEVYDALMNERALTLQSIDAILAAHGVDMTRAKATLASPETTRHIADIHTIAAALRLQGTPHLLRQRQGRRQHRPRRDRQDDRGREEIGPRC